MRNRIRSVEKNKDEIWIRIPTKVENSNTLIKDVKIDNSVDWKKQHIMTFRANYGKDSKIEFINEIYAQNWKYLADFNIKCISECCKFLNIKTKLVKASELNVNGSKSNLLLNICKIFSADEYLSTIGSKDYLEKEREVFQTENIKISYHVFEHPKYKQKRVPFVEKLSILDFIFNEKENTILFFN